MERHKIQVLARRLTIGLTISTVLVTIVLITIHYFCYSIISQRQMNTRMRDTYDLAKVLVIPLWNTDINMIRQISEAYMTCEYISGVRVETDYGKILYENLPVGASHSLIREEKIRQSDHYFGRLKLQFTREGTERTLKKSIINVIIISFPVIVVFIIASHMFIRYLLNKAFKPPTRKD